MSDEAMSLDLIDTVAIVVAATCMAALLTMAVLS